MNLKEKLEEIAKIEAVQTPWEVKRIFGKVTLCGSQISIIGDAYSDYVDLEEFRQALNWLVEQSGGTIAWDKKPKKGASK